MSCPLDHSLSRAVADAAAAGACISGRRWGSVLAQDHYRLLTGKVGIPEAAVPLLPRPHLFALLNDGLQHRVTALSAPAGAGKTMLLASWARSDPTRPVAWLSLDERDNRPEAFWPGVAAALLNGCPEVTAESLAGAALPAPSDEAFAHRLLEVVRAFRSRVVLVVDDIHVLTEPAVLAGLDVMLRHAPATLRLVLSGRGAPMLPLARLRIAGDLVDLDFANLAGTPQEAREMLALLGLDLAPDEVGVIMERTEGWVGGFRLAVLWSASQPAGQRDLRNFAGDERVVADYLNDEVLAGQSADVRDFLLRTCLVDSLTGELADCLTGRHDGARTLDDLERVNGLVAAVGPHRTWFRYRPLLREFLRSELLRRLPAEIPELRRRAALWYAEAGLTTTAVRNAVEGGDWGLATRLLVADDSASIAGSIADAQERLREREPLLARIPEDQVAASPELATVLARQMLSHGDPDGADPYLRIAEPLPDPGVQSETPWDRASRDELAHRLRYAELRLTQACLRGRVDQGILDAATKLLDVAADAAVVPRLRTLLGSLAFRCGLAQIWGGQMVSARVALERALRCLDSPDQAVPRRRAQAWLALLSAVEGRLADADRALNAVAGAGLEDLPPPGETDHQLGHLAAALVCLHRDQLDDAWDLLTPPPDVEPAASRPGLNGEPPLAGMVRLVRAMILACRGTYPAARAELAAARVDVDAPPRLRHDIALVEAEILLAERALHRAGEALTQAVADSPIAELAADAVMLGRLQLARGEAAAALDAITPCLHGTTADTRLVDRIAARLVAAAANRHLGTSDLAAEHLEIALSLNQHEHAVRVFLAAGRTIRSLLTVAVPADGVHAGQRALLLHRFERQSAPARAAVRVHLTPSEAAVLRYLPLHLTNEEIADDLCLSVNTVKSHLRTLYRKLDVTSRRAAIAQARHLGLLTL